VNLDSLVEKAIPQILAELDPHSVYMSAKDVQASNDDLKGSFSGVGIEFVGTWAWHLLAFLDSPPKDFLKADIAFVEQR